MSEPKITPLARRLAEENGIDWRRIEGTGPDGEITERDILNFLAKVMAGEVTLEGPPPGEPPPPEGEADLEAARAALEKEGIPLDELIPKEEPASEPTTEFELELDLLEEEEAEEEEPAAEAAGWDEEEVVKDITAELPVYHEESAEEAAATLTDEVEIFREEEIPAEEEAELLTDITTELPVYEEEAAPPAPEPEPEPLETALPEEPAAVPPIEEEPPAPVTPEPEPVAAAAAAGAALAATPEAPPAAPERYRLWYRPLALGPMDALLEDFGAELGRKLPRAALLFLAARRALADLEVPLRPLKERYQVPQTENFAGFLAAWEKADEEGEGLSVVEAEPPIELTAPALALATQGMPEGQGLLILVGELPTSEEKFLERVAHYLEKPIRLLLFG